MKGLGLLGSDVPELGLAVSAAGSAEGTVGGDVDGVEVASVASVVSLQLAVGKVPDLEENVGYKSRLEMLVYLDKLVPTGRDDDWGLGKGRESDAGNPLGVAVLLDGELADTDGVPELDGSVPSGGEDLTVVGREGDGENVLGVADESSDGVAAGEVPKSEGGVPGAGKSVLSVGADLDVRDEVGVTLHSALGDTVRAFLAGQVPHDDGLVSGRGEEHVREDWGGGNLGNPAVVALEGTLEGHLLSHDGQIRSGTV